MAEQNHSNHTRFDPRFHFILIPVLLINLVITIVVLSREWPRHLWLHAWIVVMAFTLLLLAGVARSSALLVQDRVIRLEERLRYHHLLAPELYSEAKSLHLRQIIALRFASDAELPALVKRTLAEKLAPKAIKQAITSWRADELRV
jgi:hypothetical protein